MPRITYVIDHNADTVIILKNAAAVFAPWDEDDVLRQQEAADSAEKAKRVATNGPWNVIPNSIYEADDDEAATIYYRVSSRHLMLASPWFERAMKKEGWAESSRDSKDGLFYVTTTDWDPDAFLILLNIFHVRNRGVPRSVSLEMFAKIAVLVDYYECDEAIELVQEKWIDWLKKNKSFPSTYDRDLILWIWVSWAFKLEDYFEQATIVAIKRSKEDFRTLELPIPAKVSDEIDIKRCRAIESIIGQLHELMDGYASVDYECPESDHHSFQCGSIMLGALTKELRRTSLLSPRPEVPFLKLSFDSVCDLVTSIQSPIWFMKEISRRYHTAEHTCDLKITVSAMKKTATAATTGLKLSEIKNGMV